MENNQENQVFTLEDLKKEAKPMFLELPHWESGTITVKVRKVDITDKLLQGDVLPNTLRESISKMFNEDNITSKSTKEIENTLVNDLSKTMSNNNTEALKEFNTLINLVCKETLIEPKFEDFEDLRPLNYKQKIVIFEYIMKDIDNLKPFRK